MKKAPIPKNEKERLAALKQLGILDTKPEERFDRITREATKQFNVPISTVSIIDEDREWYKSCQGLDKTEGERNVSFCGHAMLSKQIFIIEDTLQDERFADNPMVINPPHIRFYAGVTLRERTTGLPVGVLCIKDVKPRKLSPDEVSLLIDLANQAEDELNRRV